MSAPPASPTANVTFLFTDIQGSTALWERHPELMRVALADHDRLLREEIETRGGHVFKTMGDAFCAAFRSAPVAVETARALQIKLQRMTWNEIGPLRLR